MKSNIVTIIAVMGLITACKTDNNTNTKFSISADNFDLIDAPVHTDLEHDDINDYSTICLNIDDHLIPAQTEMLSDGKHRVWWIANIDAGETADYTLIDEDCPSIPIFSWTDVGNHSKKLTLNGQPVIQYEFPRYDPRDIEATKKPFHHVFAPDSDQKITKGPGGLYTHHRGIFFGYNHVYIEDQPDTRIDIWHARDGERSEHEQFISELSGPIMGGHSVKIYWKDLDGNPILEEIRQIRAFSQSTDQILIDFKSTLHAIDQNIRLEGDLQHAGVQFRAAQHVADHRDQTRFIRPNQWSHVSSEDEIGEEDRIDLPWNAMNFQIDDKPYTVLYMSHPSNPDGAEMSERKYGRFGEFFPQEVTPNAPFTVQYRFWIKDGTPSIDELELRYNAYASTPEVTIGR
ncbi:hypothetical protein BH23BAC3_BH23BAC3_23000 [soil metagenome]